MRAVVGRNEANVVHRFMEECDVFLVLDDLDGVESAGLIERSGYAGEMTARLRILVTALETILPFGFRSGRVLIARALRRGPGSSPAPLPPAATRCGEV